MNRLRWESLFKHDSTWVSQLRLADSWLKLRVNHSYHILSVSLKCHWEDRVWYMRRRVMRLFHFVSIILSSDTEQHMGEMRRLTQTHFFSLPQNCRHSTIFPSFTNFMGSDSKYTLTDGSTSQHRYFQIFLFSYFLLQCRPGVRSHIWWQYNAGVGLTIV